LRLKHKVRRGERGESYQAIASTIPGGASN
jgi:hypothetical protein